MDHGKQAARDNRIDPNLGSEIGPCGVIRERVRRPSSAVPLQPAGCHQLSARWIDALYGASLAEDALGNLAFGKAWLLANEANYLLSYRHRSPNDPSVGGHALMNRI